MGGEGCRKYSRSRVQQITTESAAHPCALSPSPVCHCRAAEFNLGSVTGINECPAALNEREDERGGKEGGRREQN